MPSAKNNQNHDSLQKKTDSKIAKAASIDTTNLRKNFLWNTIGSTASAFSSLFYMMIVTRLNGIDDAGIFSFAFSTAGFFMNIGSYSGRTFQVTDKNKKTTDSDYFYLKFVTCAAMLIIGAGFCFVRGYTGKKFMIIMLLTIFRALEVLAECAYAVIQKKDRLYQVGRSLLIKSIASLAGFLAVNLLAKNLTLSCTMIIFAHCVTILFYDLPRLAQTSFHFGKFDFQKVLYLLKVGFFIFGFNFLNLYVVNSARYALDSIADDSAQTVYGIIAMPATVLALIGQYLIQPFLTSFKKLFTTDAKKFQNLTVKICLAIFGIGLIALIAAYLLGVPVLELLYAIELDDYLIGLIFIIIGGTFNTFIAVLSTALVTMRRTSDQFWIYCAISLIMLGLSRVLVEWNGANGACLSYMLSMILLFVMYAGDFAYRLRELKKNPIAEVKRATRE